MKNKIVIIIIVVILAFVFLFSNKNTNTKNQDAIANIDSRNGTYIIDGRSITLKDGSAEESIENSSTKIVTRYFGNEVVGDFNNDGLGDAGFLLTTDNGGSGLFYYFVVNLGIPGGFASTNSVFIGDRISPQSTYLNPNDPSRIMVTYADRAPGQPMTSSPTVGKSIMFGIVNGELGQIAENFEGEADPNRMSLTMTKWSWMETKYTNGSILKPKKVNEFYLSFNTDGKINIETDCNNGFSSYSADNSKKTLSFGPIGSTRMFCEGSQEVEFMSDLQNVEKYEFTSKGELVLSLKNGAGSIILK